MIIIVGAVIFLYIQFLKVIAKNEFNEISAPITDQVYLKISLQKFLVFIAIECVRAIVTNRRTIGSHKHCSKL